LARRRRIAVTVAGSLATAAALVFVVDSHRHEFAQALSSASIWILLVAVALQGVALLARTESWHITIEAAGEPSPAGCSTAHRRCRRLAAR
jgi:uncharacterized membrane protein YbhN (UPF0104 family)